MVEEYIMPQPAKEFTETVILTGENEAEDSC